MKTASWIVTSHHRPELLAATLDHLRAALWPEGWQYEIVVAHAADDRRSADIAHRAGAIVIPTKEPHPSGKRNAALRECLGDLVMTTDDDDFQSHNRPAYAIKAFEDGWQVSGIREFRRLHLASGNVVRYCGRGTEFYPNLGLDMPPVKCGTARNYYKSLLQRMNGWRYDLAVLEDHDLHRRITKRRGEDPGIQECDLGDVLADDTIICQHDKNICPRAEVAKGEIEIHGDYICIGEGHYTEAPNFPMNVIHRLAAVGML